MDRRRAPRWNPPTQEDLRMLIGAHSIIYSTRPEKDRAFLRDVLKLPHVDVGEGWLIFGLPPGEVAVHPSQKNDLHEFYLMCADVEAFAQAMREHGIGCGAVMDMGWGRLVQVTLPGGGKLGVYEPRHGRPPAHKAKGSTKKKAAKSKAAKRKAAPKRS
jgi:hypothetical protein